VDVTWPTVGAEVSQMSFVDLYRAEYAGMVRVAWLIVGSSAIAEEIVQEAFLRIARRHESLDRPGAYLRVAVINGCRNELRRSRRMSPEPPPDVVLEQPAMVDLLDGLRVLEPKQRAAIVLRYVDDRPDDEIAGLLGVRRATVRSLVHRGLLKLREVIHDV
jgi:RNA polymerase sigma factor (sigma-70 family)